MSEAGAPMKDDAVGRTGRFRLSPYKVKHMLIIEANSSVNKSDPFSDVPAVSDDLSVSRKVFAHHLLLLILLRGILPLSILALPLSLSLSRSRSVVVRLRRVLVAGLRLRRITHICPAVRSVIERDVSLLPLLLWWRLWLLLL